MRGEIRIASNVYIHEASYPAFYIFSFVQFIDTLLKAFTVMQLPILRSRPLRPRIPNRTTTLTLMHIEMFGDSSHACFKP